MQRKLLLILSTMIISGLFFIFCTDPSEPLYPPSIENRELQITGTSIIDSLFSLTLKTVTGTAPLTYTWLKNDTIIASENKTALSFNPIKNGDDGLYRCVVTNDKGADSSNIYTLTVYYPPSLLLHPMDTMLKVGERALFTTSALGTAPLQFQWEKNGTPISGATDTFYLTPPVTIADNNSEYRCVVSNTYGSVTSNSADLTVSNQPTKPEITADPKDTTAFLGTTTTFSLSVIGATPFEYQWQKNDTNITGGTDSLYTTPTLAMSDSGSFYRCIVSNVVGKDTSEAAQLHVLDNSIKPTITKEPEPQSVVVGDSAIFSLSATGTAPLAYQWYRQDTAITGADDSAFTTAQTVKLDSGMTYFCIVSNSKGKDTSTTVMLHVIDSTVKPTITIEPMPQSVVVGNPATFSVTAIGTATLLYQWYTGDSTISGATNSSFTTGATVKTDSGNTFHCIVTNEKGTDTSTNAMLHVTDALVKPDIQTHPQSITINEADSATFSVIALGSAPLTYKWFRNNTLITNATGSRYTIHNAAVSDSGAPFHCIVSNDVGHDTSEVALLHVKNINFVPKWSPATFADSVKESIPFTLALAPLCSDADGDSITFTLAAGTPTGDVITADKQYTFTPTFKDQGEYQITLWASDGIDSSKATLRLTVVDSNSAPIWAQDTAIISVKEGTQITYRLSDVYVGDNEGDSVTFTKTFGTFLGTPSTWSWTPGFGAYTGKDTICIITATDDHVPPASSDFTMTITVADSTPAVILSKPTQVDYKSMVLSWSQSTDPQFGAYKLYYSKTSPVTETSLLAATINDIYKTIDTVDNLEENTKYYFRVFSYNANQSKAGSNTVDSTTQILGAPALTISTPTITNDSTWLNASAPTISGTASSAAGIASVTAKISNNAITVTGTTSWSFSATSVYTTTKAWNAIEITANDNTGKSTTTNFYLFYKPTLSTPSQPTLSGTTNRDITLGWSDIPQCDRYLLYRSMDGANYTPVKDTTGTGYTDTQLDINTQYWYKVRGYYAIQGMTDSTALSSSNTSTTQNWFEVGYDFGGDYDFGRFVAKTNDGGYFIVGESDSGGTTEIIVLKINKSGDLLWKKRVPGDEPRSLVACSDGGFLVAAGDLIKFTSTGEVDWRTDYTSCYFESAYPLSDGYIGFGRGSEGGAHTVILRLNQMRDSVWSQHYRYNIAGGNHAMAGIVDGDGNYAALSLVANGGTLISKANAQGDSVWSRPHYDFNQDTVVDPIDLVQGNDGDYIILGSTISSTGISFIKISNTYGSRAWRKEHTMDGASAIIKSSDGGYMLAGWSSTGVNLLKTNTLCEESWSKSINTGTITGVNDIMETTDPGYIVIGRKRENNNYNVYIVKTDENGDIGN